MLYAPMFRRLVVIAIQYKPYQDSWTWARVVLGLFPAPIRTAKTRKKPDHVTGRCTIAFYDGMPKVA